MTRVGSSAASEGRRLAERVPAKSVTRKIGGETAPLEEADVAASWWKKALLASMVLLLLAGDLTWISAQAVQSPPLCYAYLNGNDHQASDLYIACQGKHDRITKLGDIFDFAVAVDGSAMALWRQRGTERGYDSHQRPIRLPLFQIQVVSLKPGFQTQWFPPVEGNVWLHPWCGAILAVARRDYIGRPPSSWTYKTYNVLTGQPLSFPPYKTFACSADGRTVIGYLDGDRQGLWAGVPPQRRIAHAASPDAGPSMFDISPNGRYVAYGPPTSFSGFCVDEDGSWGCAPAEPIKVSISDSGTALFDEGTGKTCGGWPCTGVLRWQAGTSQADVVEPVGWLPQWITPEIAASLRAWRSHENTSGGKTR